ncbi:hypothetical protein EYF80_055052 [Liparis tanakae]|uniref:Uncharacterized protein n=1 Tax=Liparis tanakae TaxID=230148 RepID=A0A4Z2F1Y6_9TELE|nr:hypothetical protein EYF80_055052 [Liparis tanakae]
MWLSRPADSRLASESAAGWLGRRCFWLSSSSLMRSERASGGLKEPEPSRSSKHAKCLQLNCHRRLLRNHSNRTKALKEQKLPEVHGGGSAARRLGGVGCSAPGGGAARADAAALRLPSGVRSSAGAPEADYRGGRPAARRRRRGVNERPLASTAATERPVTSDCGLASEVGAQSRSATSPPWWPRRLHAAGEDAVLPFDPGLGGGAGEGFEVSCAEVLLGREVQDAV